MSDIPADQSTTETLQAGTQIQGTLDRIGDKDWYRVELAPGEWMRVAQTSAGADPLRDPLLRIYDADGRLITADDESGRSNSNYNAAITFGGNHGGTYFVEAAAYRDIYDGTYSLSAEIVAAPKGNPANSVKGDSQRSDNVISVYFVPQGQRAAFGETTKTKQDDVRSEGWTAYEKARAIAALDSIAAVADLRFQITNDQNADFQLVLDTNELNNNGLLGYFYLPSGTRPSVGVFNGKGVGWTENGGLEEGGLGYATLVHEFLHGLGLEHPHDSGNPMPDVQTKFGDLGISGLNQGIFSTMSYNGGYAAQPTYSNRSGHEAGPMALDIAAVQARYGKNKNYASGDDIYTLPDAANLAWRAIWDTGGNDTILYEGPKDSTIDLRDATLTYQVGGGGFVSSASGVRGGYTIAHGVVIENAQGGAGDDRLIGNAAANMLSGGDGHDFLRGLAGHDRLDSGGGNDSVFGGIGNDRIYAGAGHDMAHGGAGNDQIDGGTGDDTLLGHSGADSITAASGRNTVYGHGGNDTLNGGSDPDSIFGGNGDDLITGGDGDDSLSGGRGQDSIFGGAGNDLLSGDWGGDMLTGGAGADQFIFSFATDSTGNGVLRDEITDFETGNDRIDLTGIDAIAGDAGNQAFSFIGADAFFAAGQVRANLEGSKTLVEADIDGDGWAEFAVLLSGHIDIREHDFLL